MKVFNLTDVPTDSLKQRGLVGRTFVLGKHLVAPGTSVVVNPARMERIRKGIQELVTVGALAVGEQPPAAYVVAKAKAPPPKAGG